MVIQKIAEQDRMLSRTEGRFNSLVQLGTITSVSVNNFLVSVRFGVGTDVYTLDNIRVPLIRTTASNIPEEYPMLLRVGDLVAVLFTSASRQSFKFVLALLST